MKKITILSALAAFLMVSATSCLKDKEFDAGNYGIQIAEVKGVSFPGAIRSPLGFGLDVSASPQTVTDLVNVTLEAAGVAETDVVVTIANTTGTALAGDIKKYNDEHGTSVQILPSTLYTVPGTLTIAAGQKFAKGNIVVSNTTSLNPNLAYGIGLTITSASSGYQVAENMKNIIIIFSVKNKYDGRYLLKGVHNRSPYTFPYETEMDMVTNGPNEVYYYWQEVGSTGHPIGIGAGNSMSWYGNGISPVLVFDLATDQVTNVYNLIPPTPMFLYTGSAPPFPPRTSRYDAPTKTIYAYFFYTTAAGQSFANRGWSDTLVYIGPR